SRGRLWRGRVSWRPRDAVLADCRFLSNVENAGKEIVMADAELPAREAMDVDVVIVGAGPAGLAAAIRLKQLSPDFNVVVVEKGSEVGAHILSGAVIDPVALHRPLPRWRAEGTPLRTAAPPHRL